MLKNSTCTLLTFLISFLPLLTIAQDDLMSMLDDADTAETVSEHTKATFKTTRIINAQTTETLKAKTLVFRINHRFGNVSDGGHGLFGFDNASNIRFAFDYAMSDTWIIGIGRSKVNEHLDGNTKYKILAQTTDNKMPISLAWFSNFAYTPRKSPENFDGSPRWTKQAHRFSYTHQLIIARKFSPGFSMEVLPTFVHRNYVDSLQNISNEEWETNDLFAIGVAGRLKLTQRLSLVADYFYTFSKFRRSNDDFPYHAPLGIGIEIETGGHVFHVNFTNSSGIIENDFIPNTPDSWENNKGVKSGVKLGFNISRVFYL
ncbi:MAG: hypothetical protein JKX73_09705 [Flavobacteriales bacterium]|nr:hypothetical protein [Flavobacteriales bacterium]